MIQSTLADLGLNDKEIAIYLELLATGTCPASTLGKRTGISKSMVRYTCQQLEKRGLVLAIEKDGTFMYTAEPPEQLLGMLGVQKRQLEKKEHELKKILPQLTAHMNTEGELPKVQFFEGVEGIKKLYNGILAYRAPIDSFEESGEMEKLLPEYVHEFIGERKKHSIFNRVICPAENTLNTNSKDELRHTKFVDIKEFPFTCDIKICDNSVNILSFQEKTPVGISIVDADIAKNFRVLFEFMWNKLDDK